MPQAAANILWPAARDFCEQEAKAMPSRQDREKSLDRRFVMAAAVAGAALLPVSAKAQGGGTKFVVDLGGVTLPQEIAAKLEHDIRGAVLLAVAKAAPHTKFRSGTLPPGARGIVLVPLSR
jgi:hypothetical protein